MIELAAGDARVRVDPERGGRLASLEVAGLSLLVGADDVGPDPPLTAWGCYPMAPWAGRVRVGRFAFEGREYELPINFGAHAIHGTTFDRRWREDGAGRLRVDLGERWPFAGHAVQEVSLSEGELRLRLEVHAENEPFPASLGWHPWFRRRLARGTPAELDFSAEWMYERDAEGIPTGAKIAPPPGPWDDCFTGVTRPPRLRWPGALALTLAATCDHWVVYSEPEHAICVEAMTGPPDALNLAPKIVSPERPLAAELVLSWDVEGD